jgi:hypothetical protein
MSSNSIDRPSVPSAMASDYAASPGDGRPIRRPDGVGAFQFAVVSGLRVEQLIRGCTPRIDGRMHRATVIAQLEVASGKIEKIGEGAAAQPVVAGG